MKKILLLILTFISIQGFTKPTISVGAYHFPPYLEVKGSSFSGISKTIIQILNEVQSDFHFKLFITTPNRRFKDFSAGKFQLMIFEDLDWGWSEKKLSKELEQSSIFMKGGEVFITNKTKKKNQEYFKVLTGKSIMGILGYHYKFAQFNSNPDFLKLNHNMTVVNTQENIINAVLSKRFDLGIITKEYLNQFLRRQPEMQDKLLISNFYDQTYKHRILFKKDLGKLNKEYIENLINKIKSHHLFIELGTDSN